MFRVVLASWGKDGQLSGKRTFVNARKEEQISIVLAKRELQRIPNSNEAKKCEELIQHR